MSTWERNEGVGLQGYDATSSSVVAYFPSNELEELRTQQQRHILKCTSVKTSEFARIKICMGEHAWYRIVILCTGIVWGWLVPELQIMQQLLTVCLSFTIYLALSFMESELYSCQMWSHDFENSFWYVEPVSVIRDHSSCHFHLEDCGILFLQTHDMMSQKTFWSASDNILFLLRAVIVCC